MNTPSRTLGTSFCAVLLLAGADRGIPALTSLHGGRSAAPPAVDSLASMYDVGGIPVIQRRALAGEVVAAEIFLLGGSRQVDASNAGIEAVMLFASAYGTKSFPGTALREAASRTGSDIGVGVTADWTSLHFVGLAEDFDSTWAVVADRLMNPTLDSAAVEIGKRRALASISARVSGPDGTVRQMAESLAFAGHPYANPTGGTVAAVTKLTPAAVRAYHDAQTVASRMVVVVAGNVTRARVESAVQRTLGTLPKGAYKWTLPPAWSPKAPAIAEKKQQLPTNYIVGVFAGPAMSASDIPAFQWGIGNIAGEANAWMRDSGLTYGAGGGVMSRGASGGVFTVSTGSPDRAMKILNRFIDLYSNASINVSFARAAAEWDKSYRTEMETVGSQVSQLSESYIYHGDFRYEENFGLQLRQLSGSDISRALRAYVKNIQWAFLGDTAQIPRALMTKY